MTRGTPWIGPAGSRASRPHPDRAGAVRSRHDARYRRRASRVRLPAGITLDYGARMVSDAGSEWTLRCDGGARGNPGPGAAGYVLYSPDGREVEAKGEYLGHVTNNVAEYRALIAGLAAAARHDAKPLRICMDSELVVRQMTGEYRVKHQGLKPLHAEARDAAAKVSRVRFEAVRREQNARADELVNQTLDKILGFESPR
jgi:ribonuclease HI